MRPSSADAWSGRKEGQPPDLEAQIGRLSELPSTQELRAQKPDTHRAWWGHFLSDLEQVASLPFQCLEHIGAWEVGPPRV